MEDRKRLNSTENNGFMSMCAALNAISDAEVLEKLRTYHPIIDEILEYRKVSKLKRQRQA